MLHTGKTTRKLGCKAYRENEPNETELFKVSVSRGLLFGFGLIYKHGLHDLMMMTCL